jgi:NAD(P)-dependent dehydrogenase (short-subunit alcohol dehydrogenase family)
VRRKRARVPRSLIACTEHIFTSVIGRAIFRAKTLDQMCSQERCRSGGRIINLSSSVVALLQPTYGAYAATKAGVEAMTSVLAKELRGRNITVNAIAPGPTATDLFLKGKPQEVIDHLANLAPLV